MNAPSGFVITHDGCGRPTCQGALPQDRAVRYLLWPGSGGATGDSETLVAVVVAAARSRLRFNRSIASTSAGIVTS
ncbi:MAG: hypothetical protein ACK52I_02405 [Pseudomonadota bacterium]